MLLKINPKFSFYANSDKKSLEKESKRKNSPKPIKEKQPNASRNIKAGVFLTTVGGVLAGLAIAHKKAGFSINPVKLIKTKTPLKDWGIFKIKYNPLDVIILSSGSILGGLAGGAIFDKKENMKAKYREGIIQMFGNILTPLICVAGGMKIFEKFENNIIKATKLKGRMAKLPNVAASALCLLTGIILGNKVCNLINEKIYHIKDDRHVKVADMSGHVDDTCLAVSLANPNSKVGHTVSRFIPIALLVCGYSTGIIQEWPDDIKEKRKIVPKQNCKKS